jgi:hypothetical protein
MTTYLMTKHMTRKLTEEEDKEIKEYIRANKTIPCDAIAAAFEAKFKTPVTTSHIVMLMISVAQEETHESR